jgi:hypothetical protein
MNTQITNEPKPTLVNVIAWMTLASGIVNLFWGLGLSLTGLLSIIGIICVPFLILPTILGIFEIIYAAKLLSNPPQTVQPATTIAILEIVCILVGNIFSVVVGILALVFYNDIAVRDYFARLNGTLVPAAPVAPVAPITVTTPEPFDSTPSEMTSPDEPVEVVIEDVPPVEEPPSPDEEAPKS